MPTLYDVALNVTAQMLPFEAVEIFSNHVQKVPENVQLAIAKAAFPQRKAIIRRYAHLSRNPPSKPRFLEEPEWQVKNGKQIGTICRAKTKSVLAS